MIVYQLLLIQLKNQNKLLSIFVELKGINDTEGSSIHVITYISSFFPSHSINIMELHKRTKHSFKILLPS